MLVLRSFRHNKNKTHVAYSLAKLVLEDLTLQSYTKKVTKLVKEFLSQNLTL